ncbi:MAG: hypothetical protein RLZ33_3147, partial [Bacteroidota bacterium]
LKNSELLLNEAPLFCEKGLIPWIWLVNPWNK